MPSTTNSMYMPGGASAAVGGTRGTVLGVVPKEVDVALIEVDAVRDRAGTNERHAIDVGRVRRPDRDLRVVARPRGAELMVGRGPRKRYGGIDLGGGLQIAVVLPRRQDTAVRQQHRGRMIDARRGLGRHLQPRLRLRIEQFGAVDGPRTVLPSHRRRRARPRPGAGSRFDTTARDAWARSGATAASPSRVRGSPRYRWPGRFSAVHRRRRGPCPARGAAPPRRRTERRTSSARRSTRSSSSYRGGWSFGTGRPEGGSIGQQKRSRVQAHDGGGRRRGGEIAPFGGGTARPRGSSCRRGTRGPT